MRKLISHFAVRLVIFTVGITITSISSSPVPNQSSHLAEGQMLVHTQPKELSLSKPEIKAPESSDLSIMVQVNGDLSSSTIRHIKPGRHRSTIIDLNLGEDIYNQEVTLNHHHNSVRYRVLQRYRTSMSISAEGPHLDLVDWRHFDSPWIPLPALSATRFRTLSSNQMDDSKFPLTTKSEIIKEVRRRVGKDWPYLLELVKGCRGPNDGACLVTISSIYLRIQKQVQARWINVGLVEFRIPMGC